LATPTANLVEPTWRCVEKLFLRRKSSPSWLASTRVDGDFWRNRATLKK
jgi:hypothetical protein